MCFLLYFESKWSFMTNSDLKLSSQNICPIQLSCRLVHPSTSNCQTPRNSRKTKSFEFVRFAESPLPSLPTSTVLCLICLAYCWLMCHTHVMTRITCADGRVNVENSAYSSLHCYPSHVTFGIHMGLFLLIYMLFKFWYLHEKFALFFAPPTQTAALKILKQNKTLI